jgi:LacI family transcriptional regulator
VKRVSIFDVAEKANVSIATVSRIVNNADYPISVKLRKRVQKVIEELNYVPNRSAQQLRTSSSRAIGLVVRDIADPYFSQIAKGVTETAMELGHMALVCNSERNARFEYNYLDLLLHQGVEGIIIAGGGYADGNSSVEFQNKVAKIRKQGIQIIVLAPHGTDIPLVSVDNVKLGEDVCSFLIERGHRNIAYIGGDPNVLTDRDRLRGFKNALVNQSLPYNEDYVIPGSYTAAVGYKTCEALFSKKPNISAIFCSNDNIAVGVLRFLHEKGILVPDDISIISIGDLPDSDHSIPPLTTARLPLFELGRQSVHIICGEKMMQDQILLLPYMIVERKSVKTIREPVHIS